MTEGSSVGMRLAVSASGIRKLGFFPPAVAGGLRPLLPDDRISKE